MPNKIFEIKDKINTVGTIYINNKKLEVGINPLYFKADSRIPFDSVIIEVTSSEFENLKSGKLKLPNNWTIGKEL